MTRQESATRWGGLNNSPERQSCYRRRSSNFYTLAQLREDDLGKFYVRRIRTWKARVTCSSGPVLGSKYYCNSRDGQNSQVNCNAGLESGLSF